MPAGQAFSFVGTLGSLGPFNFPIAYIDRFEVTNRQYQEFVDQGGYRASANIGKRSSFRTAAS